MGNHLSGMFVAKHLKQPTQTQRGSHFELFSSVSSYLALLQAGFALPCLLPAMRCALTAPFHPYPVLKIRGGIFSVALSVGSHRPGVTWRFTLWSPDFPPCLKQSGCLTGSAQSISYVETFDVTKKKPRRGDGVLVVTPCSLRKD